MPSSAAADAIPTTGELLLTEAEFHAHQRELRRLRQARDEELPRRLREARTFVAADAVEEIGQLQEERAVVDTRIARLEELLAEATVVPDSAAGEVVTLGTAVEVRYGSSGRTATYRVTGAGGTPGSVSSRSPVGSALLGRRAGDVVSVELPNGRVEELTVERVLR